jgi:protein-disulfide isomerase
MTDAERPPATATPRGTILAAGLAAVAVVIAGVGVFRLSTEMADLRESQRQLAAEVSRMRGSNLLDLGDAATRGSADAVVTLVEFSDYECPVCIKYTRDVLPQIEQAYIQTGLIQYVFRDFPIDQLHPAAMRAHEAARCAAEQERFWEMHYRLFSAPGTHTDDQLQARASESGLDVSAFSSCLDSGRTKPEVQQAINQAVGLGATGTPTFIVGIRDRTTGQIRMVRGITGAQPFAAFQQAIDSVLKDAQ